MKKLINKVHNADCLEFMKKIPDKSIDLVLTDPPYGVTNNEWDKEMDNKIFNIFLSKIKDNCGIIITSSQPFTTKLIYNNLKYYKYSLIWNKKLSGSFQNAKFRPLQITEDINIFGKEKINYYPIMRQGKFRAKGNKIKSDINKTKNYKGLKNNVDYEFYNEYYPTNIIEIGNTNRKDIIHPTQKPVSLFEYLVKTYSKEGDIILDPFLGSGTTAVACQNLKRNFIGIEISEEYCEIARQRLRQKPLL